MNFDILMCPYCHQYDECISISTLSTLSNCSGLFYSFGLKQNRSVGAKGLKFILQFDSLATFDQHSKTAVTFTHINHVINNQKIKVQKNIIHSS